MFVGVYRCLQVLIGVYRCLQVFSIELCCTSRAAAMLRVDFMFADSTTDFILVIFDD